MERMRAGTICLVGAAILLEGSQAFGFQSQHGLVNNKRYCFTTPTSNRFPRGQTKALRSSIPGDEEGESRDGEITRDNGDDVFRKFQEHESTPSPKDNSIMKKVVDGLPFVELFRARHKLPPLQVEDNNLLLYDVVLLVNLSASISFWVTHRMEFGYIPFALSEGCLLSIFWIISGLYHGMFLYSAVDGHYGSTDERGGPQAAAILALNTFVNAINLRLLFALLAALVEHRQVGADPMEQLLPLEIGCGLVLMSSWRALHSYITPRI